MKRDYRLWTETDLKRLRAYKKQGVSDTEIAEKLGRTPIAVNAQCKRHKLREVVRRRWSPQEIARLREVAATTTDIFDTPTFEELATELNRTPKAVYRQCKRLKIHIAAFMRNGPDYSDPETCATLIKRRKAGAKLIDLARDYQTTQKRLSQFFRDAGIKPHRTRSTAKHWKPEETNKLIYLLKRQGLTYENKATQLRPVIRRLLKYFPNRTEAALYNRGRALTNLWQPPKPKPARIPKHRETSPRDALGEKEYEKWRMERHLQQLQKYYKNREEEKI